MNNIRKSNKTDVLWLKHNRSQWVEVDNMAQKFYDVGIHGDEVKRRLNLLRNIDEDSDGGVATKTYAKSVTNTLYGQSIRIDDVFRDKAPMSVKVSSKNIIPFPYYQLDTSTDKTIINKNGLTFSIWNVTNGSTEIKGQIGVSGTLQGVSETSYILFSNGNQYDNNLHLNGPATFSCEFTSTQNTLTSARIEATTIKISGKKQIETITQLNPEIVFEDVEFIEEIKLIIDTTTEIQNAIIRPQLELGRLSTIYAPYINDFSGVKLYQSNENLLQLDGDVITIGNGDEMTMDTAFYVLPPVLASTGTYTVSADFEKIGNEADIKGSRPALQLRQANGLIRLQTEYGPSDAMKGTITMTFTLNSTYAKGFQIWLYGHGFMWGAKTHCKFSNIQIKVADTDDFSDDPKQSLKTTEYEFTDSPVINNIEAIYPTTSFYTNNVSALLEVTYDADIKKYIDNNYVKLSTSQVGYIDAGCVSDYM